MRARRKARRLLRLRQIEAGLEVQICASDLSEGDRQAIAEELNVVRHQIRTIEDKSQRA
jgi:hypothetical protein